ncbi:hypothetical protein AAC387_Pa03g4301 [Persea americana]
MNGLPMTQETGWPSTACCVISWVTACGPDFMKRSIHGSCSNGSVVSKPSKKESNLSLPIPMGVGVFMVRLSVVFCIIWAAASVVEQVTKRPLKATSLVSLRAGLTWPWEGKEMMRKWTNSSPIITQFVVFCLFLGFIVDSIQALMECLFKVKSSRYRESNDGKKGK